MPGERFARSLGHRADQTGLLLAAARVPLSFQRTLMPRTTVDQALVTGLPLAIGHTWVSLVQETIQAVALIALRQQRGDHRPDDPRWSRATMALDLGATAAGLVVQQALRERPGEPLPRAAVRTGGLWLSLTGSAASAIGAFQEIAAVRSGRGNRTVPAIVPAATIAVLANEILRRRRARLDADLAPLDIEVDGARALGLAVAVAGGTTAVGLGERVFADAIGHALSRVLPGNRELYRPIGHAVALGLLFAITNRMVERAFHRIEDRETSMEAAFDLPPLNPLVSGSPASLVDFPSLSRQGRRFAWTVNRAETIDAVLGETGARSSIRVYAGLASAGSEQARVDLVLAELDRTGAFERKWLLVASPTGTGYTNYAAVSVMEVLSRGDCSTVAMQYAAKPSVLSLMQVKEGRAQVRLLLDALHTRLRVMPAESRPKLVLFGESLGAWSSQDPFVDHGTQGLVDRGVDFAIWIGTPEFSKWKEQVLNDERTDVDPSVVGVFNDIGEWRALSDAERGGLRYVMITHHNDGVARFGPQLLIQRPLWLGPPETRPSGIPRSMRWAPAVTFFQVLVDMKNSARVVPGKFAATGHDYRADLLPFFHAVLGFEATDEQLARIEDWLQRDELARSEWIKEHGAAGKSLAAAVVDEALSSGGELAVEIEQLMRQVAERDLRAGGGMSL